MRIVFLFGIGLLGFYFQENQSIQHFMVGKVFIRFPLKTFLLEKLINLLPEKISQFVIMLKSITKLKQTK